MDFPDVPLKMYQVTWDMKKRREGKQVFTLNIPATSPDAAAAAVTGFCLAISEATAHLYITDGNRQTITVTEVDHVRVFSEAVND